MEEGPVMEEGGVGELCCLYKDFSDHRAGQLATGKKGLIPHAA